MSACISREGEYGEHRFDGETLGSRFNCARCFAFDEDAADEAVRTAEAENATLRARLDEVRALAEDYAPAIKRQLVCDGREDCPCTFCEFVDDLRAVLAPAADAATGGEGA